MAQPGEVINIPSERLVIYQILLDRFSAGPGEKFHTEREHLRESGSFWCGGSLKGVLSKLDYICSLGCNAVWLSPWQKNTKDGYHGYFITDFFSVDPRFGEIKDLQAISKACHDRGLLLIGDFVPNHASSQHPFFLEAQKDPTSQYRSWFFWQDEAPGYECFLQFAELAKLNLDDPDCQKHIIDAAKFWVDQGVDMLRLDHCLGPTNTFWQAFVKEVRKHKPTIRFFGEAFFEPYFGPKEVSTLRVPGKERIQLGGKIFRGIGLGFMSFNVAMRPYVGVLDGCLDFGYRSIIHSYATSSLPWLLRRILLSLRVWLHSLVFPRDFTLLRFVDNHDVARLMFECKDDQGRFLDAMRMSFKLSGGHPMVIYQGTEVGLSQPRSFAAFGPYGDLMCRTCMPWQWAFPPSGSVFEEIRSFVRAKVEGASDRL
jgi:glycosidase